MSTTSRKTTVPTLLDHAAGPLSVGEPDVAGPLAVFPVFGAEPGAEYLSLAEATTLGLAITEQPDAARVGELRVANPTGSAVLLYEGEEVLGAQQNRTFDTHVLVGAGVEGTVSVSCVERGRWDHRRHGDAFSPSPQAAYPELRRLKNRSLRSALALGAEARADQGEVWEAVAARADLLDAAAPTEAMSDLFVSRRDDLGALRSAVRRRDHQVGTVVAISGRLTVLDCVSRPDAFAALHGPLVEGYALDADGRPVAAPPSRADAAGWLAELLTTPAYAGATAGLGVGLRFDGPHGAGTALALEGELIALCAFAA